MRHLLCLFAFVLFLAVAAPAEAQLRSEVPQHVPVKVMDEGESSAFRLNKLFSPEHFQMRHSYTLGYNSFGGMGLSMGEYTNTMLWRFSSKLAARTDIAFAHTPFGTGNASALFGGKDQYGKVYLKNAEVAYRPTDTMSLHLSFRQSPYGPYMSPYGYYGARRGYYGYGHPGYGYQGSDDFFLWR